MATGVTTAVNNFIQGEIQWIAGYMPPLPPFPPLAATAASTLAAPAAAGALPTRIVSAVEDAVAPATDAVESTHKTVADPTDVKVDPQDQGKADATQPDTPKTGTQGVTSGVQDAVKDTVNSVRDTAKKAGRQRDQHATTVRRSGPRTIRANSRPSQAGRLRR
ncbi:MAG TPA: hypothetical protein VIJ23_09180 [Mycobacterium sp.]